MANEKRLIDPNDVYKLFNERGLANLHVGDIDEIRRVDAVEVVHGRWIKRPDERICPFCDYNHAYFGGKDFNYCPNCGAKMDGGEENV